MPQIRMTRVTTQGGRRQLALTLPDLHGRFWRELALDEGVKIYTADKPGDQVHQPAVEFTIYCGLVSNGTNFHIDPLQIGVLYELLGERIASQVIRLAPSSWSVCRCIGVDYQEIEEIVEEFRRPKRDRAMALVS